MFIDFKSWIYSDDWWYIYIYKIKNYEKANDNKILFLIVYIFYKIVHLTMYHVESWFSFWKEISF